jgi:hypothetical protein
MDAGQPCEDAVATRTTPTSTTTEGWVLRSSLGGMTLSYLLKIWENLNTIRSYYVGTLIKTLDPITATGVIVKAKNKPTLGKAKI